MKVAKFRKWYYDLNDWVQFEEISDAEERAQSAIFEKILQVGATVAEGVPSTSPDPELISCPAASGSGDDVCFTCHDPFEQYWDEEEEEWHLKDAVRVGDKTYHPVCYEDAKEMSLLETPTPTPSTELMNPLASNALQSDTQSTVSQEPNALDNSELPTIKSETLTQEKEVTSDNNTVQNNVVVKSETADKSESDNQTSMNSAVDSVKDSSDSDQKEVSTGSDQKADNENSKQIETESNASIKMETGETENAE